MNSFLAFFFCVLAFVAIFVILAQFVWPRVVTYRITDSSVEVRLLGFIPQSSTKIEDILEIRKVSFSELLPWKNLESLSWFRLGNRLWGDGVLIKRRRGIFRKFIITPSEPEQFVQEVGLRINVKRNQ